MTASAAHCADSFQLELEGVSRASFVTARGLGGSRRAFMYREGGAAAPRQFRGSFEFSNLILERGVTRDSSLFDWFRSGEPRSGAIVLLGGDGRELVRWTFARGWPCAWEGPGLDAAASTLAIERIEIRHEGIEWASR